MRNAQAFNWHRGRQAALGTKRPLACRWTTVVAQIGVGATDGLAAVAGARQSARKEPGHGNQTVTVTVQSLTRSDPFGLSERSESKAGALRGYREGLRWGLERKQ